MTQTDSGIGHRSRLRQRFQTDPDVLSEAELLELLLTYAIPRQDVAPLAKSLLLRFHDLDGVLAAPRDALRQLPGVGEQASTMIEVVAQLVKKNRPAHDSAAAGSQPPLFEVDPDLSASPFAPSPADAMRTFADDEAAHALAFIPQAARFDDLDSFRRHLTEKLPYNSESTRQRRAGYIVQRFFRQGRLDTPLTYYAARCSSEADLKPVLFYQTALAEPLVRSVADDLIWPALPQGQVGREEMRTHISRLLPDLSAKSQAKVLHALFSLYEELGVGGREGNSLRVQMHPGTLESFLYVLTAEFPQPGIYAFDALEQGAMRRWLLWDREWMRRQLYNLQDLGVVAKISEIDMVRQFTLSLAQPDALRRYYENPDRALRALRENGEPG